jgi:hypothetical protein
MKSSKQINKANRKSLLTFIGRPELKDATIEELRIVAAENLEKQQLAAIAKAKENPVTPAVDVKEEAFAKLAATKPTKQPARTKAQIAEDAKASQSAQIAPTTNGHLPTCSNCVNEVETINDSLCADCKTEVKANGEYVTCAVCGKSVPKKTTLKMDNGWVCADDKSCAVDLKAKAKAAIEKQASAKAAKAATKKPSTGTKKAAAGVNDLSPLTALENKRHQTSIRYQIWEYTSKNPETCAASVASAMAIEIAVVRDCVKKMIADGKMLMGETPIDAPAVEETPVAAETPAASAE